MIIVRSPHRISFAGGGTDMREYYKDHEFGAVCSIGINRYVYVTINNLGDYFPHRFRIAYSKTELAQSPSDIHHPIVREALKELKLEGGIDINVMSDIPAGTGMGSSSAFTVSLLHALSAFRNRLISKEDLAKKSCFLEIEQLKEPYGKQDQYAAAFGGINLMKFYSDERVTVEPIPMSEARKSELLGNLMLFYLGGNRDGAKILQTQHKNTSQNSNALAVMRDQALEVARILSGSNGESLDDLGKVLLKGWELKKSLASGISSSSIDDFYEKAMKAGATGGKLLGAGGTGFVLFYVPKNKQAAVRESLHELREIQFQIDHMGSTLLYFGN